MQPAPPRDALSAWAEAAPRPRAALVSRAQALLPETTDPRLSVADFDGLCAAAPLAAIYLDGDSDLLTMQELREVVHRAARGLRPDGQLAYLARDPERVRDNAGLWPGERRHGIRYRPLRHHLELLRAYGLRFCAPAPAGDGWLLVRAALDPAGDTHTLERGDGPGRLDRRYGPESAWRRFDRLEEPEILDDLLYAISRMRPTRGETALALGCNDGRELALLPAARRVGIDGSAAAIVAGRRAHPDIELLHLDFDTLTPEHLPAWDHCLILGVLQSPRVDRDRLLRTVLRRSRPEARLLISLPNCHLEARDVARRPRDRRSPRHDRGAVHKDLRYLTRYLYRAGFARVECFGTYDYFLLAES